MSVNTEKSKKIDALLNDEQDDRTAEEPEDARMDKKKDEKKQDAKKQEAIEDPIVQLRTMCKGTLKLMFPIRARSKDIHELHYDFCALSGTELLDALDSAIINNMFAISNTQAMALFATTAANCTEDVDKHDVLKQISAVDSVKAIQLSKLFYSASSRRANKNISKN